MNALASMVQQMLAASSDARQERQHYNPRPKGQIQDGSATEAVLSFFQANPKRSFTRAEVIAGTLRTPKAVNWALYYLASRSLVKATPDKSRNERYLRYKLTLP